MAASNDDMAREKLEEAKGYVIETIAETMDVYGVTPAAGKLYATMYFKDQMNLDEMREELGMSKPSMSTSVRKLQENEMVKKKFQRGSRKHTYAAEKNFFHSFMSYFCQLWDREAKMNMEAIKQAEFELDQIFEDENVSAELVDEARKIYELLDQSKIYYRWLERLVASIRSEEIYEFLPKDPDDKNT
ncbi:MAG: choline uptake/conversion transcriptional regulator CudC [Bacillota bacterium]|uniref:HTH-type transcriptional regulator n=1 Tax=Virgibacillus salarius TaxID=447199 RepID=A0A941DVU3_9BACI|nr:MULTISPECIES: GbsR/MarR family transcriptional regulator [Bacillaceae]NAZ09070.1 GbsR/MarR family transcriptional regulator [Agaribacter marinus]MBR7796361.1 GbsR/MarR family transcriptional regulator [Virgibacillus salarius]MCC2252552.1 GbsR/MarR family transcriptional regulator [Virgibacillus sp. AGTR]MDY7045694.1 GbsR/MarR family transcriptional regulator [Virgibacillus sp. M23]QRZ19761.1 GbsR/MarR family transcriptional regulator [Virgibacillus sp. AGTR]